MDTSNYPGTFTNDMRYGGFRPSVFLQNGLVAAFFLMTAVVAAATFWRTGTKLRRLPPMGITTYLSAVLVLCKSLGALVYGVVIIPLVRLASPKLQFRAAWVLVAIAVTYPLLRTADLIPTKQMVDAAKSFSEDRAGSLVFRFDNEQRLLERASQRIVFGWGRFGRNRVYNDFGSDVGVTDGRWIITIGQFGIFGFIAEFGLLALPIFRAASALRFAESEHDRIFLGALALIIAINVIDLLPNASLSPWTWLLAGALLGRVEALRHAARQSRRADRLASLGEPQSATVRGQSTGTQLRAP